MVISIHILPKPSYELKAMYPNWSILKIYYLTMWLKLESKNRYEWIPCKSIFVNFSKFSIFVVFSHKCNEIAYIQWYITRVSSQIPKHLNKLKHQHPISIVSIPLPELTSKPEGGIHKQTIKDTRCFALVSSTHCLQST